jgi:DNA-binding MarR family transcriptional regulator/GNAT superfamily N-acetyltransferase
MTAATIDAVRAFNRFYTGRMGLLRTAYLDSPYSLTEARVLFEIGQTQGRTATQIGAALSLDAGYLSRMMKRFEREGLLRRIPFPTDRRLFELHLTEAGNAVLTSLEERANHAVDDMLGTASQAEREALAAAMTTIRRVLSDRSSNAWHARPPVPGDIGWVIERHATLYAAEYHFDHRFELMVADVAAAFLRTNDPARERAWIAEHDGARAGSVFLVQQSPETAKLRLLLVEPWARGLGIGKGLVAECLSFARSAGYRRITLWTNDILVAARGIYQAAGFRLITEEPHNDFGPPMIGEEWERTL